MALEPYALTTAAAARIYVKRAANQVASDDILEPLINAYSKQIIRYTGREFTRTPGDDTDQPVSRTFTDAGNGFVSLAPYELRSLGGTGYGGQGAITLASGATTSLSPAGLSDEGTYWRLGYANPTRAFPYRIGYLDTVTVTGYWGLDDVPADVELALWMCVASRFRNPEGWQSRTLGELSFSEHTELVETGDRGMPQAARDALAAFSRAPVI